MQKNIVFTGVGIYHPEHEVDNSYFINHFSQMGIQVESLLNASGKKKRFLDDTGKETIITMGYNAARRALEKADTGPEEIDLLIFATDSPEYNCPSNALYLHGLLNTANANIAFDLNTNCSGMASAFDIASRMLKENGRLRKALVIGSLLSSLIASRIDPVIYSLFADSGAAVVLEKKDEAIPRGFIDSDFKTDSGWKDKFMMPFTGFSRMYDQNVDVEDKKLRLEPFDTSFVPGEWVKLIKALLGRNNYTIADIDHFLFSQFSKAFIDATLKEFDLPEDRQTYVGDKYGYTGVTSPFMALHDALEMDRIEEGNNIIICSLGAGYNMNAILYTM